MPVNIIFSQTCGSAPGFISQSLALIFILNLKLTPLTFHYKVYTFNLLEGHILIFKLTVLT